MLTIEFCVFIKQSPQEVFDFMANPENDLKWQKGLISSEWITPTPAAAGSNKRVVTRFKGMKLETTVKYTAWDAPNSFTFLSDDSPFSVGATTIFEAKENGTQLISKGQIEGKGLSKLIAGLAARQAQKDQIGNYERLREILEAS
jgi:hypothetical protein